MTSLPIEILELHAHMRWADALVWSRVLEVPQAAADARIRGLLHHVHSVQWVYRQLFRGEAVDIPEPERFDSAPELMEWGRRCHAELAGFLSGLDAAGLEREIDFPWAKQLVERLGTVHPTSLRRALLQLPSHSTYHRGQINARIREVGGEPPLTDFVAWIWTGRPEPGWPPAAPGS